MFGENFESSHLQEDSKYISLDEVINIPELSKDDLDQLFEGTVPEGLLEAKKIIEALGIEDKEHAKQLFDLLTQLNETVFEANKNPDGMQTFSDIVFELQHTLFFDPKSKEVILKDKNGNKKKSWKFLIGETIHIEESSAETGEKLSIDDFKYHLNQYGIDHLGVEIQAQEAAEKMSYILGNSMGMQLFHSMSTQSMSMKTNFLETLVSDIHIQENEKITLDSSELNKTGYNLDTIFVEPKPEELLIQNPGYDPVRVWKTGGRYRSHISNQRPPILPGVQITNLSGQEKTKKVSSQQEVGFEADKAIVLENVEDKKLANVLSWDKDFTVDYGYTRRADKGRVIASWDSDKGYYTDREGKYIAIYDGVRLVPLEESLTTPQPIHIPDIDITSPDNQGIIEDNFESGSDIPREYTHTNQLKYNPKETYKNGGMALCAKSAREFSENNLGLIFDRAPANQAVHKRHADSNTISRQVAYSNNLGMKKRVAQMNVGEIKGMLDKHLPEANVVHAGYKSYTTNGRKHGHANIFVHVEGEGWMVYDAVWPFSGKIKNKLRPIKDMTSYANSIQFNELAYYNAPIGVTSYSSLTAAS